jgi:hypothetical protein
VLGEIDNVPSALGSAALMTVLGWSLPQSLKGSAAQGGTRAYVGWAGLVHGCIAFADAPVPEAKDVIATLRDHRLQTILLSGDASHVVAQVAATLAIPQWQAELLPEDSAIAGGDPSARPRCGRRWLTMAGARRGVGRHSSRQRQRSAKKCRRPLAACCHRKPAVAAGKPRARPRWRTNLIWRSRKRALSLATAAATGIAADGGSAC